MKLSETLKEVIALGDTIRDYWDTELPKRHPDYPFVHPGEDDGPPPPEEEILKELLDTLPEDEVFKLALIAYLGRGAFGTDDLTRQYEALKDDFGGREEVVSWIVAKAGLADNLSDGLEELRKNHIDVDALLSTPTGSRK